MRVKTEPAKADELYTMSVEQAGKLIGVGRGAAYKYARSGELPTLRVGKRLLILREPFLRMLTKPEANPTSKA